MVNCERVPFTIHHLPFSIALMNYIFVFSTFVGWALVHSWLTRPGLKQTLQQRYGTRFTSGFYRLFYNGVAVVTLVPVFIALALLVPHKIVWAWPRPGIPLAYLLQLSGLIGLTASLIQTDLFSFLGLRQAISYLQGQPQPNPTVPFVQTGTYALVRHPLYLFSLLILWFTPTMSLVNLIFAGLATAYFWLGSFHEERQLSRIYGQPYHAYQKAVPRLIPFPRRKINAKEA